VAVAALRYAPSMTEPVWEFPVALPRHAFSARDAARAGDLWRAFQEAAVGASSRAGWSARRFSEAGTAFVVRTMTVRHHRETYYGEPLHARTWVCRFRREMISSREVRLLDDAGGLVAEATQEWVHIDLRARTPVRAPESVTLAFPEHDEGQGVELPAFEEASGPTDVFSLRPFYTSMDPLGHANHPAYVDWCDEATSRVMVRAGLDPLALEPVAEQIVFRGGVGADELVEVQSRPVGVTAAGDLVLRHRVRLEGDVRAADATTVRRLHGLDPALLRRAFGVVA
jgi:acyl-CoA thioesterase FadM